MTELCDQQNAEHEKAQPHRGVTGAHLVPELVGHDGGMTWYFQRAK